MGKKDKSLSVTPEIKEKSLTSSSISLDKDVDDESEMPQIIPGSLSPIAHPLADSKLRKKTVKTIKKATKAKDIRRGVKEVVKSIRKGHKGMVILAGDVSPMDVLSHIPILCEEASIPYVFLPSKLELGVAAGTKRPTCCLMIIPKPNAEYIKYFDEVHSKVKVLA